jgi:hypothetical protein
LLHRHHIRRRVLILDLINSMSDMVHAHEGDKVQECLRFVSFRLR